MVKRIFLFNLDTVIMKEEIWILLARATLSEKQYKELEKEEEKENILFKEKSLKKIQFFGKIPISQILDVITNTALNEKLVQFIQKNKEQCYIVTEYPDIWIQGLMEKIGMEQNFFASKAKIQNNLLSQVVSIIEKKEVVNQLVSPYIAIGSGNSDAEMIETADIGIGFGGGKEISMAVLESTTYAIYEEGKLCQFLERLL